MDATYIDLTIRLSLALLLGGAIGIEREYRAKEAGFRTHFLVALGSALFCVVSQYGFGFDLKDSSRVAAQVVSGIGYLPEERGERIDYCCRLVGDGSHRSGVRYGNVCGCSYYHGDGAAGTGSIELLDSAVGNLYHRTEFLCSIKGQREGIHQ